MENQTHQYSINSNKTSDPPILKQNISATQAIINKLHLINKQKAQTNIAKRVRKVPETEPKSPCAENGRSTAPPPQVEIGGAKTQAETEIDANSQPRPRSA